MNYNKIIFLDVDGVLNSRKFICSKNDWHNNELDPKAVKLLADVVKKTKAKIVVSSTWRLAGVGQDSPIQKSLRAVGGEIICDNIIGSTEYSCAVRGKQINNWINDNNFTGKFVIIDDDSDMDILINHLVKTSFQYGLTKEKADIIIQTLNA